MALMTINDVAAELKVHPRTVKRWIADGQLAAFKLGDRAGWRVSPEDLQRFLEQRRRGTEEDKATT